MNSLCIHHRVAADDRKAVKVTEGASSKSFGPVPLVIKASSASVVWRIDVSLELWAAKYNLRLLRLHVTVAVIQVTAR